MYRERRRVGEAVAVSQASEVRWKRRAHTELTSAAPPAAWAGLSPAEAVALKSGEIDLRANGRRGNRAGDTVEKVHPAGRESSFNRKWLPSWYSTLNSCELVHRAEPRGGWGDRRLGPDASPSGAHRRFDLDPQDRALCAVLAHSGQELPRHRANGLLLHGEHDSAAGLTVRFIRRSSSRTSSPRRSATVRSQGTFDLRPPPSCSPGLVKKASPGQTPRP